MATGAITSDPPTGELAGSGLLSAALDDSPALIYIKDHSGRYVRVNRRLTECLETDAGRLLGRTDEELSPAETIDGPRLQQASSSGKEPLQLEYVVEAFAQRPAIAVLRFAVLDDHGNPIGSCGVAAPVDDAALARSECTRLLALAGEPRHNGATTAARGDPDPEPELDPELEKELRDAWTKLASLDAELVRAQDSLAVAEQLAADAEAVVAQERERAVQAEAALAREDERAVQAEAALAREDERAVQAEAALARERERAERAEAVVAQQRVTAEEVSDLGTELGRVRASLAVAEARVVEAEEQRLAIEAARAALIVEAEGRGELAALLGHERERAERAEAALAREREQADAAVAEERERILRREGERDRELETERAAAAERLAAANALVATERARAAGEIAAAREEAERASQPEAAPAVVISEHAPAARSRRWGAAQQHALSTTLARFSDWSLALREAVKTLGAQGGWDLACAWTPDERLQRLRCAATWCDPAAELAQLETATWQELPALHASPQGSALHDKQPQWLAELDPGDRRFNTASKHGMSCGLLIPVHDATAPVALVELLGRDGKPPDVEQQLAFAAIAVQLGHLCRLVRLSTEPRWGSGRV
ncbi:MAG: PAS domain-containing protein [Solirubrobacteraceae bacterium]